MNTPVLENQLRGLLHSRGNWGNNNATRALNLLIRLRNRPNVSRLLMRNVANAINRFNLNRQNFNFMNTNNGRNYEVVSNRNSNSNSNNNNVAPQYPFNENKRRNANIPVNRSWNNFKNIDPISRNNKNNWKGNSAIEVNTNGRKTYFYPSNFNRWFGNTWKNMPPNSNNSIHPTKRHPLNRSIVKRKQVRLVKFTGNKS